MTSKLIKTTQLRVTLKNYFYPLILIAGIWLLALNANHHTHDSDIFWHIGMGRDLIEKGFNPFKDHYSFTMEGAPIKLTPVPFQVLSYGFWKIFGEEKSFFLLTFLLTAFPFFLFWRWLKKTDPPVFLSLLAVSFALWALIIRGFLRPELMAFTFILVQRWLLERADRKVSYVHYLFPILFLWLWINTHVTCVYGYFLVFSFLGGRAVTTVLKKDFKPLIPIFLLMALAFGLGWANFSLTHPVIFGLQTPKVWNQLIVEHLDVAFLDRSTFQLLYWIFSGLGFVFFIKRKNFNEVFLIALFIYSTSAVSKTFPAFVFATLPACLHVFQDELGSVWFLSIRFSMRVALAAACMLTFGYGSLEVKGDLKNIEDDFFRKAFFPVNLIKNYLSKNLEPNKIFSEHWASGYLIYSLGDKVKFFIDGRTNILYPPELMYRYVSSRIYFDSLLAEQKRFKFQRILAYFNSPASEYDLMETALFTGEFFVEYQEDDFVLLSREKHDLFYSSKVLMHTECIDYVDKQLLEIEAKEIVSRFPMNSEFRIIIGFLVDELKRKQKSYPDFDKMVIPKSDRLVRILAYLAYKNGDYVRVIRLIHMVQRILPRDAMIAAASHLNLKEWNLADETFVYALNTQDPGSLDLLRVQIMKITGGGRLEKLPRLKAEFSIRPSLSPELVQAKEKEIQLNKKRILDLCNKKL